MGRRGESGLPRRSSRSGPSLPAPRGGAGPAGGARRTPAAVLLAAGLAVALGACGGDTAEDARAPELTSGSPRLTAQAGEAGAVDSARVADEVEAMLEASTGSWNAGDLDGFVDDYLDSPEMTYVGGSGVVRGRDALRERYRATYWAEGEERDSLRFEDLEVRPLGGSHALALGRYVLYRVASDSTTDSTTATGRFTLVLRRQDDGTWTIVHDHSS